MIYLLQDQTTTGAGNPVVTTNSENSAPSAHTFGIFVSGNPTAVVVEVQATCRESDNWAVIQEHTLTAEEIANEHSMFHVINKPLVKIRMNVKTLTGGTSPSISCAYVGGR